MLEIAEGAATRLEAEGVSCSVWDPRVVKPLDPVMIQDAARHDVVVTIEDGLRDGGIGQAIRDQILASTATPVVVMGVPTMHIPHGKPEEILAMLGLDTVGVVAETKKHL